MKYIIIILGAAFFLIPGKVQGEEAKDYAVTVSAHVQEAPPSITLHWLRDLNANGYQVWRKNKSDNNWGQVLASLPGYTTQFTDSTVAVGSAYEYSIAKTTIMGYQGHGYIYAGIKLPVTETRGTVILLVDDAYSMPLREELVRLEQDMAGDGWHVVRHDVSRQAKVTDIKSIILADYNNDHSVRTVFLFGHVPVPYSGDIAPDGHGDHYGAWPADGYYGDRNGIWTDNSVLDTTSSNRRNHNIPGDGKFDQSMFPSDIELEVGRVDVSDLPVFGSNDTLLHKQYLDKNHLFRHKFLTAREQGYIVDNFDTYGEAFAQCGWRSFSAMFGDTMVAEVLYEYWPTVADSSYLWSYGCGFGHYGHVSGVGTNKDFVNNRTQSVFLMLFGSYNGDWDNTSNILRCALAAATHPLAVMWAGRPFWEVHHMAMGDNLGYATLLPQNNNGSVYYAGICTRYVHISLLGDPTLRMHVVAPPSLLEAQKSGNASILSWYRSPEAGIEGYFVYRSDTTWQQFTRLNSSPVTDTFYTDATPPAGQSVYMVRALKLQASASGTYYDLSQGIFNPAKTGIQLISAVTRTPAENISILPNPTSGRFVAVVEPGRKNIRVSLLDITGKTLLTRELMGTGAQVKQTFNLASYRKGIYLLKIWIDGKTMIKKVVYH